MSTMSHLLIHPFISSLRNKYFLLLALIKHAYSQIENLLIVSTALLAPLSGALSTRHYLTPLIIFYLCEF